MMYIVYRLSIVSRAADQASTLSRLLPWVLCWHSSSSFAPRDSLSKFSSPLGLASVDDAYRKIPTLLLYNRFPHTCHLSPVTSLGKLRINPSSLIVVLTFLYHHEWGLLSWLCSIRGAVVLSCVPHVELRSSVRSRIDRVEPAHARG